MRLTSDAVVHRLPAREQLQDYDAEALARQLRGLHVLRLEVAVPVRALHERDEPSFVGRGQQRRVPESPETFAVYPSSKRILGEISCRRG